MWGKRFVRRRTDSGKWNYFRPFNDSIEMESCYSMYMRIDNWNADGCSKWNNRSKIKNSASGSYPGNHDDFTGDCLYRNKRKANLWTSGRFQRTWTGVYGTNSCAGDCISGHCVNSQLCFKENLFWKIYLRNRGKFRDCQTGRSKYKTSSNYSICNLWICYGNFIPYHALQG